MIYLLEDKKEERSSPDQLTLVISILLVVYGVLGMGVLAFSPNFIQFWYVNIIFIVLGVSFFISPTDIAKTILGIIGLIGSFYAAILWADYIHSLLSNVMVLYSLVLLALCFGAVCHVTCTWPNLDYDQ